MIGLIDSILSEKDISTDVPWDILRYKNYKNHYCVNTIYDNRYDQ